VGQLPDHLGGADLARVRAALKLRHEFIRTHLPRVGLILLAALGLAALVTGGGKAVAQLLHGGIAPVPAPAHDDIAHIVTPRTPRITPVPARPIKDPLAQVPSARQPGGQSHADSTQLASPQQTTIRKNPGVLGGDSHAIVQLTLPIVGGLVVTNPLPLADKPEVTPLPTATETPLPFATQVPEPAPVVTPVPVAGDPVLSVNLGTTPDTSAPVQ